MDWGIFIKISHIIGTVLGVGGEIFGSIFYFKALKDGKVDAREVEVLRICFGVLHIGLVILVLSGFGYFLDMRLSGITRFMFEPRLIAKLALVVILVVNALLLQTRKIPDWLGGSISIVSWFGALILGAWRGLEAELWQMTLVYLAGIIVAAIGERIIRTRTMKPV